MVAPIAKQADVEDYLLSSESLETALIAPMALLSVFG